MSIPNNNTPPLKEWGPAAGTAAAAFLFILALLVYRPWEPRPFQAMDFSEFLPLLAGADGPFAGTMALVRYYAADHARLNVVSYAGLALKWSLFGDAVAAWQWARFVEMLLLVGGVFLVLRRLAVRPLGAFAGALLFVVAKVAGEGWTRLTMGEPLGLLCMLGAIWLSVGWRTAGRQGLRMAAVALLATAAVLAKEMFAGMLPFLWLVGIAANEEGRFAPPQFDGAARRWLLTTGTLPILAFLAAALLAMKGGSQSFTSMYGESGGSVGRAFALFPRAWFVQGSRASLGALLLPANTILLVLYFAGGRDALRDREGRQHYTWALGGAVALSLALALLYAPWPYFNDYYALPFLLGPALVLGLSVDALSAGTQGRWIASLVGVIALGLTAAPSTAHTAAFNLALQRVNGGLAATFGQLSGAREIVVATRDSVPLAWAGHGQTLRRFALATGPARTLPPASDKSCPAVGAILEALPEQVVVISYHHFCGPLPAQSARFIEPYRYALVTWGGVHMEQDSVAADLLVLRRQ